MSKPNNSTLHKFGAAINAQDKTSVIDFIEDNSEVRVNTYIDNINLNIGRSC